MADLGTPYAVRATCAWLGWPLAMEAELREWMRDNHAATRSGDYTRTSEVATRFDAIIRRLLPMMLCVCLGTGVGIGLLTSGSSRWPSVALGGVLAVYALLAFFLPRLAVPATAERLLSPVVGAITGVLTGATGVFVVPAVPYLSALGFSKDELVQALGLSFTVSTVALGIAMGTAGSVQPAALAASVATVAPALLGMFVGQRTRNRIAPAKFRRWFFLAMLAVGLYMVARGLLAS